MTLSLQLVWLFALALPIASIAWTVTHEDIFREPREYCIRQSESHPNPACRKFFFLFTCEFCFSHYVTAFFLLITRYNPNRVDSGQMLSLEDIQDILRIKLIGVVPESETVLNASNQGVPAVYMKGTDVSEAYKDVVERFLGKDKPMRFVDANKGGFFARLFGAK